jgi:hypothetical protein
MESNIWILNRKNIYSALILILYNISAIKKICSHIFQHLFYIISAKNKQIVRIDKITEQYK